MLFSLRLVLRYLHIYLVISTYLSKSEMMLRVGSFCIAQKIILKNNMYCEKI